MTILASTTNNIYHNSLTTPLSVTNRILVSEYILYSKHMQAYHEQLGNENMGGHLTLNFTKLMLIAYSHTHWLCFHYEEYVDIRQYRTPLYYM